MTDKNSNTRTTEHNAERWTGLVLRLGVWISACVMIAGMLLAALAPSAVIQSSANPSLGALARQLVSTTVDPATVMYAGLVLLMFTPVLRVLTALFGFAVERDWRFVVVSSIVLLMLTGEIIYSMYVKG